MSSASPADEITIKQENVMEILSDAGKVPPDGAAALSPAPPPPPAAAPFPMEHGAAAGEEGSARAALVIAAVARGARGPRQRRGCAQTTVEEL